MQNLFIALFGMSINAGWLVLAAFLFRLIFKNAPKSIRCVLWGLAGIRLVLPFSFQSIFSLVPKTQYTSSNEYSLALPYTYTASTDTVINTVQQIDTQAVQTNVNSSFLSTLKSLFPYIWLVGLAVMLFYAAFSFIRLCRKVSASIQAEKGIRICDDIYTPFILGIIKPIIYLPSSLSGNQLKSVISHETAHIKRLDFIWKPLGFLLLSVYWFNPLMWLGYILLCRDIELACDEKVIKDMDTEEKKEYSNALLSCSIPRKAVSACPLAFGETGVKGRIKTVLNYKKPAFWVIIAAVAVCIILAVCFLTDPPQKSLSDADDARLHEIIMEHGGEAISAEQYPCEDHIVLRVEKHRGKTRVYALVWYGVYEKGENGLVEEASGWHVPSVITFDDDEYNYEESEDGTNYVPSIRKMFPWYLQKKAININEYSEEQDARCMKEAGCYFAMNDVYLTDSVPQILYGDSEKVLLHADFGILVYRIDGSIAIISAPTINPKHIYSVNVSADGKRLYVTDMVSNIYAVGINPLVFDTETLQPCDSPENDEMNLCKAVPDSLTFKLPFEPKQIGTICDSHDGYTWYSAIDTNGFIKLIRQKDGTDKYEIYDVILEHFGDNSMPASIESDDGVDEFIKALLKKHSDGLYGGDVINHDECRNVTPDEVMQTTDIRLFKFSGSCSSFVFADGEIYDIPSFGGYGLHNAVPCDFDNDGVTDLLISSSWGSGIHRSEISVFNRSRKELTTIYTNLEDSISNPSMSADLSVRKSGAEYQILTVNTEIHENVFDVSFIPINVVGAVECENGEIRVNIFED